MYQVLVLIMTLCYSKGILSVKVYLWSFETEPPLFEMKTYLDLKKEACFSTFTLFCLLKVLNFMRKCIGWLESIGTRIKLRYLA